MSPTSNRAPARPLTLAMTAAAISATAVGMGGCLIVVGGDGWDHDRHSYHAEHRAERSWSTAIDAAMFEESVAIRVATRAGDITIERTAGPASMKIHAASRDADRLSELTIEPRIEHGTLIVEPDWPGGWQSRDMCEIVLRIPVRDGVTIETTAGDVLVDGMQGRLTVETSAGDIDIRDHNGSVRAETSAGDIAVSDALGPIEVRTSAGDIDARMNHGFSGLIRASTTSGELDLPGGAAVSRSGAMRSGTARLGDDSTECVFRTSSGDISVQAFAPRE